MRRFVPSFSCWLLALWFMATLHCSLEAAISSSGDEGDDVCCPCCLDANGGDDGCDLNESGAFKPANDTPKLPPPTWVACPGQIYLLLKLLPVAAAAEPVVFDPSDQPRAWVVTWVFVRRAALPPGAPSVNCV